MKYLLLMAVKLLLLLILASCAQQEKTERKSEQEFSVISDTLFISDEQSEVLVGRVRDIAIGRNGTIYLLDSSDNAVKVFDSKGNFVREMLSGQGRGPGETINPNSIFVDRLDNLYITDLGQNKILVLNADNLLIAEAVLPLRPSNVVATNPNDIYVTGFRFSYSGDLIQHYSQTSNNNYELISTFAERGIQGESRDVSMSGWSDQISIDNEGKIYVGRFFPYHIDIYNAEKEKVYSLERELDFITKPKMDMSSGMVTVSGVVREPLPLSDGQLLIRYFEMDKEQNRKSYFDLYSSSAELITTISFEQLGISENAEYFISDIVNNVLYAGFNDPFPGLIRYKIELN